MQKTAMLTPGMIRVTNCGKEWTLYRPADLESLWEAMGEEQFSDDERLPYWVELWPASLALAEYMHEHVDRVTGKKCLDLGCGLGFTAMIASWLGAKVVGMDYEQEALTFAQKNARANNIPEPLWVVMDWRASALLPGSCEVVLAGDIMYEERFVDPVLCFLETVLAPSGVVWIAEPARSVYKYFQKALEAAGWQSCCLDKRTVEPLHVQSSKVSVNIWELSRKIAR